MTDALFAGLLAFVGSLTLTPLFRARARRLNRLDVPNERSSHRVPTPRNGGHAIALAVGIGVAAFARRLDPQSIALSMGAVAVALLALADERRSLSQGLRLVVQVVVAAAALVALARWSPSPMEVWSGQPLPAWMLAAAVVLWVTWVVNAYNFMDGINGIAAGEAVVCGLTLWILFGRTPDVAGQILALSLAGAAAGFLPWNFPSGSIFMGDVGSYMFGFLFAALSLRAAAENMLIPAILPLLPFLADATVTLLRRIIKREPFYRAHRSHYYQRLTSLGWSHSRVTLLWTVLATLCALVAVVYVSLSPVVRAIAFGGLLSIHATVALAITGAERARLRVLRKAAGG